MNPVGDFARADMGAMLLAQQLQGLVMDYIQDAYFAEEDLNLGNLTYDRFLKEYEKAKDGDTMNELNRQLAAIIGPVIQQVFMPPPAKQE